MVRFLLLLTLLLINPIRNSYAQYNACYCTTSWHPNAVFGQSCTANADCWACAPGAYSTTWQQAFCSVYQAPQVSTCTQETQFQTQSCPVNQSGIITQSRTKICPQNVWSDWQTTSNTCTPNPPTCQVTSQQQTLACQTGYTGSITQIRSSTCPNPYGSPVMGAWTTTTNTCVKSATNPTNPVSPVSPLNPTSPASNTSVQTTQSSPVTVSTPNTVPNSVATPTEQTETSVAPTAGGSATKESAPTTPATGTASPTTSTTPTSKESPPKGKVQSAVGLALSLDLFQKPALTQPNVFPDLDIVKGIPNSILMHDNNLMQILGQPSYNQQFEVPDLGFEQ
jgi:hypothetical protein